MKPLIWPLIFLLGACSSTRTLDVDIDIPSGQYGMTPETIDSKIYGGVAFLQVITNDVELGGTSQTQFDFSNSPEDIVIDKNSTIDEALGLGMNAHLGVYKYFEVIFSSITQYTDQVGLKVCLFFNCFSQEQGFKAALYGLYGYDKDEETGEDDIFSEPENDLANVTAFAVQRTRTAGLILGYRTSENFLISLNLSHTKDSVEAPVYIEGNSSFILDSTIESSSILAGARFTSSGHKHRQFFVQFESGYNLLKLRNTNKIKRDSLSGAFNLGASWY